MQRECWGRLTLEGMNLRDEIESFVTKLKILKKYKFRIWTVEILILSSVQTYE